MAEGDDCILCHEEEILLKVTTDCHHHFCGKCIVRWMVHNYHLRFDRFPCPLCRAYVSELNHAANEGEGQEGQMLARLTKLFSRLHALDGPLFSWAPVYREIRRNMIGTIRDFMADEGDDFFVMLDRIKWRDTFDIEDTPFLKTCFFVLLVIGAIYSGWWSVLSAGAALDLQAKQVPF